MERKDGGERGRLSWWPFSFRRQVTAVVKVRHPWKPDPTNDPNEAYAVNPTPAKLRGPPTDWWCVTKYGVPVWFFPADKRALAERFATDPAYRLNHASKKKARRRSTNAAPRF